MRGGYMGMLMFGMLGTFVGFASLINPLGIGAGLSDGRQDASATSASGSSPGGRTRPRPRCAATSTT